MLLLLCFWGLTFLPLGGQIHSMFRLAFTPVRVNCFHGNHSHLLSVNKLGKYEYPAASRFQLDPALDLELLVNSCPDHMTGADLYALCSDAMTSAIKRKISLIVKGKSEAKRFKA